MFIINIIVDKSKEKNKNKVSMERSENLNIFSLELWKNPIWKNYFHVILLLY